MGRKQSKSNPAKENLHAMDAFSNDFLDDALKKYGSWKQLLNLYGEQSIRKYLIKEVQSFYQIHGRTPKRSEMKHSTIIYKILGEGSWGRAMRVAGLETKVFHKMTEAEMIQLILATGRKLGHTPRSVDIPQAYTIIRHFGSWNAAIRAAGLEPWKKKHNSRVEISNEELLFGIQILMICNHGRRPYFREYEHAGVCLKRFGKWNDAIDRAIADPFHTMETAKIYAQTESLK